MSDPDASRSGDPLAGYTHSAAARRGRDAPPTPFQVARGGHWQLAGLVAARRRAR